MAAENPGKPKGSYHHGDLRHSLVRGGAEIIAERGVEALTLREVGQRVGVSRTALYRHFDDKGALLEAVALEGFRTIRADLEAALAMTSGDPEPLVRFSEAYLGFGTRNPSYYRTMFGPALRGRERNPDLRAAGHAAFGVLVEAIRREQDAGRFVAGDPVPMSQVVWGMLHGIVSLGNDGQFGTGSPAPEPGPKLLPLALRVLLSGMIVRPDR